LTGAGAVGSVRSVTSKQPSSAEQIACERLHLESCPPRLARYEDRGVRDELPRILNQLGLADTFWTQTLEREWVEIVGPQLARHTRPGRFQYGVLYVFVANSVWLAELNRMGQKPMLANIQKRFGADRIKSLRLQIDPEPPPRR